MAKLRTPTSKSYDMCNAPVAYADGLEEVDYYGPNARLTFWMAESDEIERAGVRKVVVAKVVIPTAELMRIARQLVMPEGEAAPGEPTACHTETLQ
jgi:hypothetical protein